MLTGLVSDWSSDGLSLRTSSASCSQARDLILWCLQSIVCCYWSVALSCPTLCDPMDCSTPGSSVFQCLPEFAQIHVH